MLCGGLGSQVPGFEMVETVEGFAGLALNRRGFPPLRVRTEPRVYIHQALGGAPDGPGREGVEMKPTSQAERGRARDRTAAPASPPRKVTSKAQAGAEEEWDEESEEGYE